MTEMGHGNGAVYEVAESEKKNGVPQGIEPPKGRMLLSLSLCGFWRSRWGWFRASL